MKYTRLVIERGINKDMKYYKSQKVFYDWEIDACLKRNGCEGWKPILMTPVIVEEGTKELLPRINFHIFFERDDGFNTTNVV